MKDSTSSADSVGERTPKDYAIEHAEYMARKAERLLDAVQEHAAAYLARENDGDDPDSDEDISSLDDRCNRADEGVNEAMMHMRSGIYEFRKRRDRALAVEEPKPQAEPWQPIETAPKDGSSIDVWVSGCRIPEVFWGKPKLGNSPMCWCCLEYDSYFGWIPESIAQPSHWMPMPAGPALAAAPMDAGEANG